LLIINSIENLSQNIQPYDYPYQFSICTLVNRMDQYEKMLRSFIDAGFSQEKCEYLYLDNSQKNLYDAFRASNIFLQRAKGRYIIICHQDIELRYDKFDDLERRIDELDKIDTQWALVGNAGAINLKYMSKQFTHGVPPIHIKRGKYFPQKVRSLDENFILVKKDANLAVSSDLAGFHFYGLDICLIAHILGFNAYVIDFHLYHESRGNKDDNFFLIQRAFQDKYQRAFKGRYLNTVTKVKFFISGSRFFNCLFSTSIVKVIAKKYFRLRLLFKGTY
jgi:hypothetical protein